MLYFRDKIRAGTWKSAPALTAWVLLLNIFVKRCTSSDLESKSLFKAGAKSQGVAITSESGRGGSDFGGEIETRGSRAIILAFYPRSHVQLSAEGMARNR